MTKPWKIFVAFVIGVLATFGAFVVELGFVFANFANSADGLSDFPQELLFALPLVCGVLAAWTFWKNIPDKTTSTKDALQPQVQSNWSWEQWFANYGLPILGCVLIVAAFVWFLGDIFKQLNPWAKDAIGAVIGLLLVWTGTMCEERYNRHLGNIVVGLGSATLYFTAYAMHFIAAAQVIANATWAIVLLVGVSIALGALAYQRYQNELTVLISIVAIYFSLNLQPINYDQGLSSIAQMGNFIVLLGLTSGLCWLSLQKNWHGPLYFAAIGSYSTFWHLYNPERFTDSTTTAFISTALLVVIYGIVHFSVTTLEDEEHESALGTLNMLFFVPILATTLGSWTGSLDYKVFADWGLKAYNHYPAYRFTAEYLDPGLLYNFSWGIALLVLATIHYAVYTAIFLLDMENYYISDPSLLRAQYALLLALPLGFLSGHGIAFWLFVSGLFLITAVGQSRVIFTFLAWLSGLGTLTYFYLFEIWQKTWIANYDLTIRSMIVLTLTLLAGYYYWLAYKESKSLTLPRLFLMIGTLPALIIVSGYDLPSEWISAAWATAGLVILALGIKLRDQAMRYSAIAIYSLMLIRFIFWDLAGYEGIAKVIAFFIIGILSIGASLYHRKFLQQK